MRKFGRVRQSRLDMFALQRRVAAQNFRMRCPFRQAVENIGYQHASALGAQLPRADTGVGAEEVAPIGHSAMVTSVGSVTMKNPTRGYQIGVIYC